jgi:hypothetical protein
MSNILEGPFNPELLHRLIYNAIDNKNKFSALRNSPYQAFLELQIGYTIDHGFLEIVSNSRCILRMIRLSVEQVDDKIQQWVRRLMKRRRAEKALLNEIMRKGPQHVIL